MNNSIKGNRYLWLSLLTFASFLLEYFSILVIEKMILKVNISQYTGDQRAVHCLIMSVIWLFVILIILFYSQKKYHCFKRKSNHKKIMPIDWIYITVCLLLCKIMTYIDWHTLKVFGEAQGKSVFQFFAQYMYYMFEIGLVLLIIIYGQKAFEIFLKRETLIPFGGIVLAMTWGIFHFVSRGVGLEIWNGISCMIFALLSGIIYLRLKKRYGCSYLLIAIGYLL